MWLVLYPNSVPARAHGNPFGCHLESCLPMIRESPVSHPLGGLVLFIRWQRYGAEQEFPTSEGASCRLRLAGLEPRGRNAALTKSVLLSRRDRDQLCQPTSARIWCTGHASQRVPTGLKGL